MKPSIVCIRAAVMIVAMDHGWTYNYTHTSANIRWPVGGHAVYQPRAYYGEDHRNFEAGSVAVAAAVTGFNEIRFYKMKFYEMYLNHSLIV